MEYYFLNKRRCIDKKAGGGILSLTNCGLQLNNAPLLTVHVFLPTTITSASFLTINNEPPLVIYSWKLQAPVLKW